MKVRIVNKSEYKTPAYATNGSAGVDFCADIQKDFVVPAGGWLSVPTGIYVELPEGVELQIRPRSGLASRYGLLIPNSPGTIDSDYRGEIKILVMSLFKDFTITPGMRIAQGVFARYERAKFELVDELSETERGEGGFGSTGK